MIGAIRPGMRAMILHSQGTVVAPIPLVRGGGGEGGEWYNRKSRKLATCLGETGWLPAISSRPPISGPGSQLYSFPFTNCNWAGSYPKSRIQKSPKWPAGICHLAGSAIFREFVLYIAIRHARVSLALGGTGSLSGHHWGDARTALRF